MKWDSMICARGVLGLFITPRPFFVQGQSLCGCPTAAAAAAADRTAVVVVVQHHRENNTYVILTKLGAFLLSRQEKG